MRTLRAVLPGLTIIENELGIVSIACKKAGCAFTCKSTHSESYEVHQTLETIRVTLVIQLIRHNRRLRIFESSPKFS